MTAEIIDGKKIAAQVKSDAAQKAVMYRQLYGRQIGLAVILVGSDPASEIYVRNKKIACEQCNIAAFEYNLPAETSQDEIIELIEKINADKNIDGLLVQLPLPKNIDEKAVLSHVSPQKDVDGFHAVNAGNLVLGNDCLAACTPSGIIRLIDSTGVDITGKHAVVVGRSNIVGKPAALMLLKRNATVTVCHSKTKELTRYTSDADVLVAAIGKKEFFTGDMIKPGAIVIDVGMNRENGKLYGDVHFPSAVQVASYITPVPGGVGPMTVAMLIENTVKAAYRAK